MAKQFIRLGVSLVALMPCMAFAADMDESSNAAGGYYGNIHAGVFASYDRIEDEDIIVPSINLGGKLALDNADSPWGWQVDSELNYTSFDWITPRISDVDGSITTTDTTAHLTYRPNSDSKLGFYAGYGTLSLGIEDTTGGSFDLFDETGVAEASVTLGALGIGVEGLTTISDSTWVQGRVGLVDPIYISASLNDGTTTEKASRADVLGNIVGGTFGGSLHHRFTDQFSTRIEGSYTVVGIKDADSIHALNVGVGANYTLAETPLTLGVTAGYNRISVDGDGLGGFIAGTKLTYSFGGPSSGSIGKLFRSGAIGLTPN